MSETLDILEPSELYTLTGKKRRSAQRKELDFMGIAFIPRSDGFPVVIRSELSKRDPESVTPEPDWGYIE